MFFKYVYFMTSNIIVLKTDTSQIIILKLKTIHQLTSEAIFCPMHANPVKLLFLRIYIFMKHMAHNTIL